MVVDLRSRNGFIVALCFVLVICSCFCVALDTQSLFPSRLSTTPAVNGNQNESALSNNNGTSNGTAVVPTSTPSPVLPSKNAEEEEKQSSLAIFFILFVLILSILLIRLLIVAKLHYIPESLAIVALGAFIGLMLTFSDRDWTKEEAFSPNAFFLVLLPPIIFESGYNLHKGNFFANFGSILVFAILGTVISAIVVGGGVYILGQADLIYRLTAVQSFSFGSLISAVDPVATLAIFQALSIDPLLYMLVFGESILNDASAIVLASTVMELNAPEMADLSALAALRFALGRFLVMFFASATMGIITGLMSALLLKHVDLRKTPSLEIATMLIFSYLPYGLAEGLHLSGIMAILFCGIVMSHYTHFNLSPISQITLQQIFRTLAFVAETCVFAYLGMAFFTYPLIFKPALIIWSIVLILAGRAFNIFPLSYLVNRFRSHKINKKTQFVMWFSGLRGAIAFALSLHLEFAVTEAKLVMITTTLSVVVFTLVVLGGSTMPLLKLIDGWFPEKDRKRRKKSRSRAKSTKNRGPKRGTVSLSKTFEKPVINTDYSYSDYTETEDRDTRSTSAAAVGENGGQRPFALWLTTGLKSLVQLDVNYLRPFFVRKFTQQEKKEGTLKLTDMMLQWYQAAEEESETEREEPSVHYHQTAASRQKSQKPTHTDNLHYLQLESTDEENDQKSLI